jgi:hypothetical protein
MRVLCRQREARTRMSGRDDGYDGMAEIVSGDAVLPVSVRLAGHFDAISGSYCWYGRVAADPAVAAQVVAGTRTVTLRTPQGGARTRLTDVDPWGRDRVEGFGVPPFRVMTDLPSTESATEDSAG